MTIHKIILKDKSRLTFFQKQLKPIDVTLHY